MKSCNVYVEVITRLICIASSFICGFMNAKLSCWTLKVGWPKSWSTWLIIKTINKLIKSVPERDFVPFAEMAAWFLPPFLVMDIFTN